MGLLPRSLPKSVSVQRVLVKAFARSFVGPWIAVRALNTVLFGSLIPNIRPSLVKFTKASANPSQDGLISIM